MAVLVSYVGKSKFIATPVILPADSVQFRVSGHIGRGSVSLSVLMATGGYEKCAEITTSSADRFVDLLLLAGDTVVVEFNNCDSASAVLLS